MKFLRLKCLSFTVSLWSSIDFIPTSLSSHPAGKYQNVKNKVLILGNLRRFLIIVSIRKLVNEKLSFLIARTISHTAYHVHIKNTLYFVVFCKRCSCGNEASTLMLKYKRLFSFKFCYHLSAHSYLYKIYHCCPCKKIYACLLYRASQ